MNLIPRNPLFELDRFFDNSLFSLQSDEGKLGIFAPKVDVKEQDNAYHISAELPGVNKDDVHVSLENGILTLEAETKQEDKEEKEGKVIRQERRYGRFVRSFDLGPQVKESDIKAHFENGVLDLVAPKVEKENSTAKRIEIS